MYVPRPIPTRARLALAVIVLISTPVAFAGASGVEVRVSHKASVGDYLTDSQGRTLYLFEKDEGGKSTCYGACAHAWPPLETEGSPVAGSGVEPNKLSRVQREDGSLQVTYEGWPLYRFVKDDEPGDAYGQDVEGFGGEWYMVSPQGRKVEAENGEKSVQDEQNAKQKSEATGSGYH